MFLSADSFCTGLEIFSRNLFTVPISETRTDWATDTRDKNNTEHSAGAWLRADGCPVWDPRLSVDKLGTFYTLGADPMVVISTHGARNRINKEIVGSRAIEPIFCRW